MPEDRRVKPNYTSDIDEQGPRRLSATGTIRMPSAWIRFAPIPQRMTILYPMVSEGCKCRRAGAGSATLAAVRNKRIANRREGNGEVSLRSVRTVRIVSNHLQSMKATSSFDTNSQRLPTPGRIKRVDAHKQRNRAVEQTVKTPTDFRRALTTSSAGRRG